MRALADAIRRRVRSPELVATHDAVDAVLWKDHTPDVVDLAALTVRLLGTVVLMTPEEQRPDMAAAVMVLGADLAAFVEEQG